MHTTAAPAPWPRPRAAAARPSTSTAFHESAREWLIQRNCAIAPCHLLLAYGVLCAVCLLIAAGFAWVGATPVLAFAGLELLLVGAALLVYARHALDGERITLVDDALRVERSRGSRVQRSEFDAAWVRVEPPAGEQALIRVSCAGRSILVGSHLQPALRAALARDIQSALQARRLAALSDFNPHTATKRTR